MKLDRVQKAKDLELLTEGMTPDNLSLYAIIPAIALNLGVHRNTILNWNREDSCPEWTKAYDNWLNKRDVLFMSKVDEMSPAQWIFLAKNWLGMHDRRIHEVETNYEGILSRIQSADSVTKKLDHTRKLIEMPSLSRNKIAG